MMNRPFCPVKVILVRYSGRVALCPLPALTGHYNDVVLIYLTGRQVNTPYVAMKFERE
jgi:hypothetical protein